MKLEMNIDEDALYGALQQNINMIHRTLTREMGSEAFDLREIEELGAGRWGVVFSANDPEWVWKLSGDPDEGPVIAAIMANNDLRNHPGICYYGGVWAFPKRLRPGLDQLYLILREELLPIDQRGVPFTPGEEVADDLLDDIIVAATKMNAAIEKRKLKAIERTATKWGTMIGQLSMIDELVNVADFMQEFLAGAGGALADAHRSNCGVREIDDLEWVIADPGVSSISAKQRIPLLRANPGIIDSIPILGG